VTGPATPASAGQLVGYPAASLDMTPGPLDSYRARPRRSRSHNKVHIEPMTPETMRAARG